MKYFPFAPNIPWYLRSDFIIPKMDANIFSRALQNKNVALVCYGGFFETYFSLSILELLNTIYNDRNYYWKGNKKYYKLIELNNLISNDLSPVIEERHLRNYPLPLFFDRDNFVYFNCLNDYVTKTSLIEFIRVKNSKPLAEQIFANSFNKWNHQYIPRMRQLRETNSFKTWCKVNSFNINERYVLVFPDRLGWSIHQVSNLSWNIRHLRALSTMLKLRGVKTIVVTNHKNYNNHNIVSLNPDIENILLLMNKAEAILSEEIDFTLIGLLNSSAKIIGMNSEHKSCLDINKQYLNSTNSIFLQEELKVIDVFNFIMS